MALLSLYPLAASSTHLHLAPHPTADQVQDKRKDLTSATSDASETLTETHQAFIVQPPEASTAELITGDATISTLDLIAAPTDWEKPRIPWKGFDTQRC
jgi:hypothetical protein